MANEEVARQRLAKWTRNDAPPPVDPALAENCDGDVNVSTPSESVRLMESARRKCRVLMGGTRILQGVILGDKEGGGADFLPQEQGEEGDAYQRRVRRSVLSSDYADSVRYLVDRVFVTPVLPNDDVPTFIRGTGNKGDGGLWQNIDAQGNDATEFFRRWFTASWNEGMAVVVCDNLAREMPDRVSLAEATDKNRPYLRLIEPGAIVRATPVADQAGAEKLGRLQIRQSVRSGSGGWNAPQSERIWVLYRAGQPRMSNYADSLDDMQYCRYEYWRKDRNENWGLSLLPTEAPGMMKPFREIPAVPFFTGKEVALRADCQNGFWEAGPPLEELAYLCIQLFQETSDFRGYWRFVKVPVIVGLGLNDADVRKMRRIGGGVILYTEKGPSEADLKMLESTGTVIKEAREDLASLRENIRIAGRRPTQAKITKTLGQFGIEVQQTESTLQASAAAFKDAIEQCLMLMAQARSGEAGRGGSVKINTQQGLTVVDPASLIQVIMDLRKNGDLSRETTWEICRGWGALPEEFDAAMEQVRLSEEQDDELARLNKIPVPSSKRPA